MTFYPWGPFAAILGVGALAVSLALFDRFSTLTQAVAGAIAFALVLALIQSLK
jgi:hypothetical protein